MTENKLVRGTMLLTSATFLSKILGLIYVVPFTAIVGQAGNALYGFGFIPYTVLLSLATLGVPLAVSKFVSKYQALGDYETGFRLLRSGLIFMLINGIVAFVILFISAPIVSNWIISDPTELQGNTMDDVVFTIRMVSVALIIVPIMSIVRGYFQGHQSMGPTAVSQVVEQIVRITFILSATFVILNYMDGQLGLAVGFATLGAFVGAIGGMTVLIYYWFKRRSGILNQIKASKVKHSISTIDMYKELISYAIPISFVGLAIPLFQLIDLFSVNNALINSGLMEKGETITFFAIFTQTAHKIILIPMALGTAFSITLIPTITKSFTTNDYVNLQNQITKTFQVILFLTLPAAFGMSTLSYFIFGTFYGLENFEMGGMVLRYYAPVTLLFSIFAVSSAILQGINKQKFAVIALIFGLLIKLSLNYMLLYNLGPLGGILATYLGFGVAISITCLTIRKYANYSFRLLKRHVTLILFFTAVMSLTIYLSSQSLQLVFPAETWINTFIVLLIGLLIGTAIYLLLGYRYGLVSDVLGSRLSVFNRKNNNEASKG
jgi:O-antigen/teichoic acid export membrane protein